MSAVDRLEATEVQVPTVLAGRLEGRSSAQPDAIAHAMGMAFQKLQGYVERHGLSCSGPPRTIYTRHEQGEIAYVVAFPIAPVAIRPDADGNMSVGEVPGGPALRFTHRGPYAELGATYARIGEWLKEHELLTSDADWSRFMPMWEEYLNDPATTGAADLMTYIYLPNGS